MSAMQISMNTVRRYIKELKAHMYYCRTEPHIATTIEPSVLELRCFRRELYKFCQNPEAEFDEEEIKSEIDEKFLFYYFWNAEYKRAYENNSLYRYDERGRFVSTKQIVEEDQQLLISRFEKSVIRCALLIRQECLKQKPRSPQKVFREIRQKNLII